MINDKVSGANNEGMNSEQSKRSALDYYREKDAIEDEEWINHHYWGDWTDEDPYSNVDRAEELEEEYDYWNDIYTDYYWDNYDWEDDYDDDV